MKQVFIFIISVLLVTIPLAANESHSGKVRSVLGEVTRQKKDQNKWLPLRVGAKVSESDLIRTLVESQAIISLADGSSITIEENTITVLEKLLSNTGFKETSLNIKKGMLHFNVQKQAGKSDSFKFKTGTATAAIRGTSGAIGITKTGLYASLAEGSLEVENMQGNKVLLKAGQTLVQDTSNGFTVLDNSYSGSYSFSNMLFKILSDSTSANKTLTAELLDSITQEYKQKINPLLTKSNCHFNSVADTVFSNELKIQGRCNPGTMLSIDNQYVASSLDSIVTYTMSWEKNKIGEKKHPINCVDKEVQATCGMIHFYYADTTKKYGTSDNFIIHATPILKVPENSSFTIKGIFEVTSDETELRVKIGNLVSENLVSTSKTNQFAYNVTLKSQVEKVIVEMSNKNGIIKTDSIKLIPIENNSDETSNSTSKIDLLKTSESCYIKLSITSSSQKDILTQILINNILVEEKNYKMGSHKYKLKPGNNLYSFILQDNKIKPYSVSKSFICYPNETRARIQVHGGAIEKWRVPPPPKGASKILNKELRFSIKDLTENDPIYIKRITVKRDGQYIVILKGNDITELDYSIPFEISMNSRSNFEIDVILHNGYHAKATKTFEVR